MNIFAGYKIQMKKKAEKALDYIHEPDHSKIIFKIDDLISDELRSVNIKKLQGFQNLYRLKVDNYRIVFMPIHEEKTLLIVAVGHRQEVYNLIKNMTFA